MARLIERIDGLRAVNAGALEMARIVEHADAAADLDQRPLQGPRRASGSPACPTTTTGPRAERGRSGIERCVVLAGWHRRRKAGGGHAGAARRRSLGDRQHRRTTSRSLGVDVSPDPDLVTYWLSGEIDEQRGWGIKGDTFTVFDRLGRLGAPDWFRLSDRDLATCLYRREFVAEGGAAPPPRHRSRGRSGSWPRCCRCAEERVRTKVQDRRGLARPPAVPGRRARPGRGRGDRGRGDRRGRAHARGPRGDLRPPTRS